MMTLHVLASLVACKCLQIFFVINGWVGMIQAISLLPEVEVYLSCHVTESLL